MPGGMEFLMDPVLHGMCKMESLYDGTLDLVAFTLMNEALLVRAENEFRIRNAPRQ